jgi:hypothetical protein
MCVGKSQPRGLTFSPYRAGVLSVRAVVCVDRVPRQRFVSEFLSCTGPLQHQRDLGRNFFIFMCKDYESFLNSDLFGCFLGIDSQEIMELFITDPLSRTASYFFIIYFWLIALQGLVGNIYFLLSYI